MVKTWRTYSGVYIDAPHLQVAEMLSSLLSCSTFRSGGHALEFTLMLHIYKWQSKTDSMNVRSEVTMFPYEFDNSSLIFILF